MPSSPELVDRPRPRAPRRFEPIALGEPPTDPVRVAPPTARWSFEAAFPPSAAPEPFVVSDRVGVPPAVLAEARRAARSEGYAAGFASGVADAHERALAEEATRRTQAESADVATREAVVRAVAALHAAAADLYGRSAIASADLEQLVLDSAYELAESLLGSALRDDAVRGTAAVRRVLALIPTGDATITVALHPDDVATLTDLPDGVRLVPDAALTPGDAVARSGDTTVEARVADGLARVREVLGR